MIGWSVSQSVGWLVGQLVGQLVSWSVGRLVSWSLQQDVNQSCDGCLINIRSLYPEAFADPTQINGYFRVQLHV